ncbi:MAG: hypothetical protein WC823_03455 [Parcubacteria group bacterium]
MIRTILLMAFFGILSAVTSPATAQTETDWRLIIQDDGPVLMKEALMTKVTNEAALLGAEKVFAACENEDGILPLDISYVKTRMAHLFKSENTFTTTKWLACDKLENFVELKHGTTIHIKPDFNPALILWLISFFCFIILSVKIQLSPTLPETIPLEIKIYHGIFILTWILFIIYMDNTILIGLPTLLLILFLTTKDNVTNKNSFLLALIAMSASLLLVT